MKITKLEEASISDACLLSSIAQKAKAHWGYPTAWLALWQKDLTFNPQFLLEHHTFVISLDRKAIGFCVVIDELDHFNIDHCWILPDHIGYGYGYKLLSHVLSESVFKQKVFQVLSDPYAIGFYQKFGFKTIKMVPTQLKDRALPLMQMVNGKSNVHYKQKG